MSLSRFKASWKRFSLFSSSKSTDEHTVRAGRPIEPDKAVDIVHEISNIPSTPNGAADITHEIYDISPRPIGFGGYSDIYTGIWRSAAGETKVAIKVIRALPMNAESNAMPRALRREISVWKRLQHRNIHVLCGFYEGIGPAPALVSPWQENGDIKTYLQRHVYDPDIELLKLRLTCDIMCGVNFLHGNSIVHGDIKGQNVLISDTGVAILCDFGLSRILADHSQSLTHTGVKGTSRWMAPEIFLEEERHSYASDMWACGCLFIEVWNNVPPYHTKANDHQLIFALNAKELPGSQLDMPDTVWTFVQSCCSFDTTQRAAALQVAMSLCFQLVMQKVDSWVTLSRPIDVPVRNLLQCVEASLRASALQSVTELYILADSELASDIVRHLSLTNIIDAESYEEIPHEVFHWCLAKIGVGNLHPPAGAHSHIADDDDLFSTVRASLEPSIIRPLARLVERARPGLAKLFMSQFANRTVQLDACTGINSVTWIPDGMRIVVGCYDGDVRILDVDTGVTLLRLVGHAGEVNQVTLSPQGTLLASCSDDRTIRLWDAETGHAIGAPMAGHDGYVWSVAFSPDGRHFVSGSEDKTIRMWSTETSSTVLDPLHGHFDTVLTIAYTPHGSRIDTVLSVAYSPDGSRIVSGSSDATVRIWDAGTSHPIMTLRGHTRSIRSVTYSPDGSHIVSGSSDSTLRIWDAMTGQPIGSPLKGHSNPIQSVAYSPDGTHIASGSYDHTVRIWDATTGASITTVRGHTSWVTSVAFSPDGKRLASASHDRTVRIWDVTGDWRRWDI